MTKRQWERALTEVFNWKSVKRDDYSSLYYLMNFSESVVDRAIDFALKLESVIMRNPKLDADVWSRHDQYINQDFRIWFKNQSPTRQAKVLQQLAAEHAYYITVGPDAL